LPREERALWALVGLGLLLRVSQYLANRAYWIDECFLVSNIVGRTFSRLLEPLDYNQAAPPLFLMAERLAYLLGGTTEFALRAVPLAGGLLSVLIFKRIAQACVDRTAAFISVGLFAMCDHLIYYSSEAKQYSTDVTAALLCYVILDAASRSTLTISRGFFFGVLGAMILWWSHPAVFALCGVSAALIVLAFRRRAPLRFQGLLVMIACWAFSFALLYFLFLRQASKNEFLVGYWRHAFMPLPLSSLDDVRWFAWTTKDLLNAALGPSELPLPMVALGVGGLVMLQGRRIWLVALSVPVLATLVASAMGKYPFQGRMILFLIPPTILLVAQGVSRIVCVLRIKPLSALIVGAFFIHPVMDATHFLRYPRTRAELRQLIEYVEKQKHSGDTLYVSWYSCFPYDVYTGRRYPARPDIIAAPRYEGGDDLRRSVDRLSGRRRVWVIWGGVAEWTDPDVIPSYQRERTALKLYLDAVGRRIDSQETKGAFVALYDCAPKSEEGNTAEP
jgi:hypothetical protein